MENLKKLIESCIDRQMFHSAVFFADKMVSMSDNSMEAISMLVECYYLTGEYKRASSLLLKQPLVQQALQRSDNQFLEKSFDQKTSSVFYSTRANVDERNLPASSRALSNLNELELRLLYLAGLCTGSSNNWEDCLRILGEDIEETILKPSTHSKRQQKENTKINILSAICLLKGRAFSALENRTQAAAYFKKALMKDSSCYEAFEKLLEQNILTQKEVLSLIDSLKFKPDTTWLKELYHCKIHTYNSSDSKRVQTELYELESQFHLKGNEDVALARAELHFYQNQFRQCYEITRRVLENDPYNHGMIMVVHFSTLVQLKLKNELFYCAHKLVEEYPNLTVSWYGVGCYYFLIGNYENARGYFSKSTMIDPHFGPGWLGFGHSFAVQGEHDQAMASYRTASRTLPGCHLALLCVGMELIGVNNLNLAEQYILQAKEICPTDPLIYNELGVICYRNKDFHKAANYFLMVLDICSGNDPNMISECWEPTVFNLGHCYRKLGQYENAIHYYQLSASISPGQSNLYTAIAYTYQLQDNIEMAIEHYHHALGLKGEDSFAAEMLNECMEIVQYKTHRFRHLVSQQIQIPDLSAQAREYQPAPWSLPSPFTIQDPPPCHPRHVTP